MLILVALWMVVLRLGQSIRKADREREGRSEALNAKILARVSSSEEEPQVRGG